MIELKRYKTGDELKIDPVEGDVPISPEFKAKWKELILPQWTWTRWDGNRIIGLGGLVPYGDNAFVWVMIDKSAVNSKPLIARGFEELEAMQKMVSFAESFRFKYIWTLVKDGFKLGHKMAKFLGFTKGEAKEDHWLYTKELKWV